MTEEQDIEAVESWCAETGVRASVKPNDVINGVTFHLGPLRWFNDYTEAEARHSAAEWIRRERREAKP